MLLRDIVDLEATYDMSDIGENKLDDTLKIIEGATKKKDKLKEEKQANKDTNYDDEQGQSSAEEEEEEYEV